MTSRNVLHGRIALRTCGRIALAVSQRILPFIDPIVARVDAAFAQQALPPRTTLYDTIGMLSCAVGGEMTGVIASLLDQMLLCPLSAPLVAALAEISRHIPVFQARIQGASPLAFPVLVSVLTLHRPDT